MFAIPDFFIYILIPTVLAFWTYRDIYVLHSKEKINYVQLGVYVVTMLVASFLFRIGKMGIFPLITSFVFLAMAMFESKETGRLLEIYKNDMSSGSEKKKVKTPAAIKKVRMNYFFALVVAILSFLNYFNAFNFLFK